MVSTVDLALNNVFILCLYILFREAVREINSKMMKLPILEKAANLLTDTSDLPPASEVVENLLVAEKTTRKEKIYYAWDDLIGSWRLRFITGTKKTRQKAGVVLGAGRYIPQFIKIKITYSENKQGLHPFDYQPEGYAVRSQNRGRVENCVQLGLLILSLTGPVRFLPQKNILAFDFTTINVKIAGLKVYDGYIRGGKLKEESFYGEKIAKQAFFAYFIVQNNLIAARGRGGGLALWSRETVIN